MKILQVLGGGAWGGGSVITHALVRTLIQRGDDVWVVCLDDESSQRFTEIGARPVHVPFWFRPINPLDAVPLAWLTWLCARERFDLVATHTSKGGFLGRLAARIAGVPRIIHHAHGFAFRETQPLLVQWVYRRIEKLAARWCDAILCVSEEHRQGALRARICPASLVQTVLNGIDVECFERADAGAARKALGYAGNEIVIGIATRLAQKKGVEDAIAAMPYVLRMFPAARLEIFGAGPMERELKELAARSPAAASIRFRGFFHNIPELLGAFDLLLQPSISEGPSIALLEAMAAGRAVVACNIQGNREVIHHSQTGWLVPPSSHQDLAVAICRLLADLPLRARMGAAARADVKQRFTQQRMIRETLALYDARLKHRKEVTYANRTTEAVS